MKGRAPCELPSATARPVRSVLVFRRPSDTNRPAHRVTSFVSDPRTGRSSSYPRSVSEYIIIFPSRRLGDETAGAQPAEGGGRPGSQPGRQSRRDRRRTALRLRQVPSRASASSDPKAPSSARPAARRRRQLSLCARSDSALSRSRQRTSHCSSAIEHILTPVEMIARATTQGAAGRDRSAQARGATVGG